MASFNASSAEVAEETTNLMINSQSVEPNEVIEVGNKTSTYGPRKKESLIWMAFCLALVLVGLGCLVGYFAYKTVGMPRSYNGDSDNMPAPVAPIMNLTNSSDSSKALEQIMQRMGHSEYDPCDNFYEFACDGVINGDVLDITSFVSLSITQFSSKISQLRDEKVFKTLDQFFKFCGDDVHCRLIMINYFDMPIGLALMEEFGLLEKAESIYFSVKNATKQLVDEGEWLEKSSKDIAIDLIDSTKIHLGLPSDYANWEIYEKMEEFCNTHVDHDSCPRIDYSAEEAHLFDFDSLYEIIYKRKPSRSLFDDDLSPMSPGGEINITTKDIAIPVAYLLPIGFGNESAISYGFLGIILAHEFSHYFDEEGWETYFPLQNSTDKYKFDKNRNCIKKQYKNNGNTTDEDFADLSGLEIAYRALENKLGKEAMTKPIFESHNFTNEQAFFISYAQHWCRKKEKFRKYTGHVHSREDLRTLNPLRNSDAFAKAFNCPVGSPMNPVEKCRIWIKP